MPTHVDFLAAVCAAPDDMAPRLILADWLDERGDPRGEFIRVQVELAKYGEATCPNGRVLMGKPVIKGGKPCGCRFCTLGRRERELLENHFHGWVNADIGPTATRLDPSPHFYLPLAPNPGRGYWVAADFRRGFVESVTLDWPAWRDHGDALRLASPLRTVRLTTLPDQGWLSNIRIEDGIMQFTAWSSVDHAVTTRWPGLTFELPPAEPFDLREALELSVLGSTSRFVPDNP